MNAPRTIRQITLGLFLAILFGLFAEGVGDHSAWARDRVTARELSAISESFVAIAGKIMPAVVGVSTVRVVESPKGGPSLSDPYFRWFFGDRSPSPDQHEEEGLGSGVLVSADGLIVTNAHVIEGADRIKITLSDRRAFKATVVGVDKKTDLAVLRVDGKSLPWVPFGDSASLNPGEVVLAVGNPFGLNQTVTMGIISGVGRQGMGISDYEDFIQTDAAINPGNSGGAMVNTDGELIGINTAIFTQSGGYEGIGFAIPSNLAGSIMDSLISHGRVVRGWLGVSIQEVTPELAGQFGLLSPEGALVTDVMAGSPAERGGMLRGDVILEIDGEKIEKVSRLRLMVASTEVGKSVRLKVRRGGRVEKLEVVLGELPEDLAGLKSPPPGVSGDYNNALEGLTVGPIDKDAVRRFQIDPRADGVLVLDVAPGSAASRAGLIPGDVIIELNRREVLDVDGFNRYAVGIGPDDRVLVLIMRRGQALYVGIEP
ncbi:MAG: Do family serine endopeptidase [Leptospirillia bacterium]